MAKHIKYLWIDILIAIDFMEFLKNDVDNLKNSLGLC